MACAKTATLTNLQSRLGAFTGPGGAVETLSSRLDDFVTLGAWSAWGQCSAPCGGGTRRRSRSVHLDSSYAGRVSEEGNCNTGNCPNMCGDNERYFNVNSGIGGTTITSYVNSNPIYVNNKPQPVAVLAAGEVYDARYLSLETGDFVCGGTGPIDVFNDGGRQVEWVPERMKYKTFVIPAGRGPNQVVYIMAADAASTYEFKRGSSVIKRGTLQPYDVDVVRFNVDAVTFTITATQDVLVSYTRGAETSGGVRPAEGQGDSMAVPGTGTNVRLL